MSAEELNDFQIGEGRYVIAVDKRVAHVLVFLILLASLIYWADATGIYTVFGKSPGVE